MNKSRELFEVMNDEGLVHYCEDEMSAAEVASDLEGIARITRYREVDPDHDALFDEMLEALKKLKDLTEDYCDEGPLGQGWTSDALVNHRELINELITRAESSKK